MKNKMEYSIVICKNIMNSKQELSVVHIYPSFMVNIINECINWIDSEVPESLANGVNAIIDLDSEINSVNTLHGLKD